MSDSRENEHLIFATVPEWHVFAVTIKADTEMVTFCPACKMPYTGKAGENFYGEGVQCEDCGARWMVTWARTDQTRAKLVEKPDGTYECEKEEPEIATVDQFRTFLVETGYRNSSVRSKNVAVDFNVWLKKKFSKVAEVDGRRMASILKKWGASSGSRPFASTYWCLGDRNVCPKCGAHAQLAPDAIRIHRCTLCNEEFDPFNKPSPRIVRETVSDPDTSALTDFY